MKICERILKNRRGQRQAAQSWVRSYRDDDAKKVAEEAFMAGCEYMATAIRQELNNEQTELNQEEYWADDCWVILEVTANHFEHDGMPVGTITIETVAACPTEECAKASLAWHRALYVRNHPHYKQLPYEVRYSIYKAPIDDREP